jgi:hypothetical protein
MKLISIIVLIIVGFLFYPQLIEDTDSSCAALEGRVIRLATENKEGSVFASLFLRGFSNGAFTQEIIKSKYPNLPPFIGCSIFYYRVILNPETVQKLKSYL